MMNMMTCSLLSFVCFCLACGGSLTKTSDPKADFFEPDVETEEGIETEAEISDAQMTGGTEMISMSDDRESIDSTDTESTKTEERSDRLSEENLSSDDLTNTTEDLCSQDHKAPIVIHEILYNPNAVSDQNGEYLELFNPETVSVDLGCWQVQIGSDCIVKLPPQTSKIEAQGYFLLARSDQMDLNGGLSADATLDCALNNDGDTILLVDAEQNEIDHLSYQSIMPWPDDQPGVAIELVDPQTDNAEGANWKQATVKRENGDYGTPGAPNQPSMCGDAQGNMVINEILYDPQAVSDSNGEYIELYNAGHEPVDLRCWTIGKNDDTLTPIQTDHPIIPGQGFFLLAKSLNPEANGALTVDAVFGFSLKNDGDTLILKSASGNIVDMLSYQIKLPWPVANPGVSIELISLSADNSLGESWQSATQRRSNGDKGTPRTPNTKF